VEIHLRLFLRGEEIVKFLRELPDREIQIQPSGVDFTLRRIGRFHGRGRLTKTRDGMRLPEIEYIMPTDGYYILKPREYLVEYGEIVKVPEDAIGFILPRSSLLRMGVALYTAVWDPGYVGRGKGLLTVFNRNGVELEEGCRIGQFVLAKLTGRAERYRGRYLFEGIEK